MLLFLVLRIFCAENTTFALQHATRQISEDMAEHLQRKAQELHSRLSGWVLVMGPHTLMKKPKKVELKKVKAKLKRTRTKLKKAKAKLKKLKPKKKKAKKRKS